MSHEDGIAPAPRPASRGHLLPLGLLVLYGLLVLSPLYRASGEYPVTSRIHWDTMQAHAPMLMHATTAWRVAGEFPLWHPFRELGFPHVVDPQAQIWSPITWFVIATIGYDIDVIQTQVIMTFLVAMMAAYWLAIALGHRRLTAWMVGATWGLCGYFVASTGLLGTMSTMSIAPAVFAGGVMALRRSGASRYACLALAGLLLAQAALIGHPTTAYVLAFNFAAFLLLLSIRDRAWRRCLVDLLVVGVIAAMIAFPLIYGTFWAQEHFLNLRPYTLLHSEIDPIAPRSLINFFVPEASLYSPQHFHQSFLAYMGSYMGILTMLGLAIALVRRRFGIMGWVLTALLSLNFFLMMGGHSPLRALLYYTLPGMNAPHRAAMDFRGFTILFAVLLAARGWESLAALARYDSRRIQSLARPCLMVAGTLMGLGILLMALNTPTIPEGEIREPIYNGLHLSVMRLVDGFIAQGILWVVLAGLLALVGKQVSRRQLALFLCFFVAFDMASSVRRTWVLAADDMGPGIWQLHQKISIDRPLEYEPDQFVDLVYHSEDWASILFHRVHLSHPNPTSLVRDLAPLDRERMQSLFGRSLPQRAMITTPVRRITEDDFDEPFDEPEIELIGFTPNTMTWQVDAPLEGTFRVLTSYMPGWEYSLDGADWAPVLQPDGLGPHYLSVPIDAGAVEVRLRYHLSWIRPAVMVMLAGYGLALVLMLVGFRRRRA